jgi:hypothetical protein
MPAGWLFSPSGLASSHRKGGNALKADTYDISKVFSNGGDIHYILPHFQREYTWTKPQWQTLLADAFGLLDESTGSAQSNIAPSLEHFLGSVVVVEDRVQGIMPVFKLVDGQQRLTTISILLATLLGQIQQSHPHLAKTIQRLLTNADEADDSFFKLLPTVKRGDRAAYQALIRSGAALDASTSGIAQAAAFFGKELSQRLVAGLDPEKLFLVLTKAFRIVFVSLSASENAYRIFESLNGKGKALTQADLIRNYVAMRLPGDKQETLFDSAWLPMEFVLREDRSVGHLPELTAFFRHYLAARQGSLCDESHVYARFRDRCEANCSSTEDFVAEIVRITALALDYDCFLRPDKMPVGSVREAMMRLAVHDSAAAYPFFLRCMEWIRSEVLTREAFAEMLRLVENYMMRRFIAGEAASEARRVFPRLADRIDLARPTESLRILLAAEKYPSDQKVRKAVQARPFYDSNAQTRRRTAFLLSAINRQLSKGSGGYTVLDDSATIEHIMPQNLSGEWLVDLGVVAESVHRDCVHTLGNLTLVTQEWNSAMSNSGYSLKAERLGRNALQLNCGYFKHPPARWDRTAIYSRADYLVSHVLELWPALLPEPQVDPIKGDTGPVMEFEKAAVDRVSVALGVPLLKHSSARYESSGGATRVVAMASRLYASESGGRSYWFGLRVAQIDYLMGAPTAYIALQCESVEKLLLVPLSDFQMLLPELNTTSGSHWHVFIHEDGARFEIERPQAKARTELSRFRVV